MVGLRTSNTFEQGHSCFFSLEPHKCRVTAGGSVLTSACQNSILLLIFRSEKCSAVSAAFKIGDHRG